jgi:non-ribosomal peptide synthetase component E (peptide arylation enzyme)
MLVNEMIRRGARYYADESAVLFGNERLTYRPVHERSSAPGEGGEIALRAPFQMKGYLDEPELNAATFLPGGFMRTRDVGRFDDDDFLHLVVPTSDMIVSGGRLQRLSRAGLKTWLRGIRACAKSSSSAFPTTDGARRSPPSSR